MVDDRGLHLPGDALGYDGLSGTDGDVPVVVSPSSGAVTLELASLPGGPAQTLAQLSDAADATRTVPQVGRKLASRTEPTDTNILHVNIQGLRSH